VETPAGWKHFFHTGVHDNSHRPDNPDPGQPAPSISCRLSREAYPQQHAWIHSPRLNNPMTMTPLATPHVAISSSSFSHSHTHIISYYRNATTQKLNDIESKKQCKQRQTTKRDTESEHFSCLISAHKSERETAMPQTYSCECDA
jgi:hypothetical protein